MVTMTTIKSPKNSFLILVETNMNSLFAVV